MNVERSEPSFCQACRKRISMNRALLVVNIRNDYFPEGKMPLQDSVEKGAADR